MAAGRLHGGPNRVAADRLRGGKSIFAVRKGREMTKGSESEGSKGECRNGGAAAETAVENEGCWDEGKALRVERRRNGMGGQRGGVCAARGLEG